MRELSLNVMDIAQNSITANASLIEIEVCENTNNNTLTIMIKDNGKGMTQEQVNKVVDPFFTSRTTRKVGLGIPLFSMAATLTGGNLEINSTPQVGTTVKTKFITNSIDMTPLGDINQTISMLIRCNPNLDFVFEHKINEKSFVLDTRELKTHLGEVPLDTPDVMMWINEYLSEQSQIILGGASL